MSETRLDPAVTEAATRAILSRWFVDKAIDGRPYQPGLLYRIIPAFGKTPLQMVSEGRGEELAEFYEAIFDRGVTQ